jgi:hypothetical protein
MRLLRRSLVLSALAALSCVGQAGSMSGDLLDAGALNSDSGAGDSGIGDAGQTVAIALTPRTAEAGFGGRVQFSANVTGTSDTSVSWTLTEGGAAGLVTATGQYTAPSAAGVFHLVATSHADSRRSDTATITVTPTAVDPCIAAGNCQSGVWVNVTPKEVSLTELPAPLNCGNFGTELAQADPKHPSDLYTSFNCQGIWKSTDFGQTWKGPINDGGTQSPVSSCAGGVMVAPSNVGSPILYLSCMRGGAVGFWRSLNGGVDWTHHQVNALPANRQDVYPPEVDPYDSQHLLMAGHEMDEAVESTNGGETWSLVSKDADGGMFFTGGTGAIHFINTGNPSTTRNTWLWVSASTGGRIGTWRTANAGNTWKRVDGNEKGHSLYQIYQPDTAGVLYMAGVYSALGWGVLRSTDYGETWTHVGVSSNENIVFGTSRHLYAMNGFAVGAGGMVNPNLEVGDHPGTGPWMSVATPTAMAQGPATATVINNGTHNVIITANFNSGLWRYVEPAN